MRILTNDEYHSEAEPMLRKIFLNENPMQPQFGSNAEEVRLLYEYYPPDAEIINALVSSASHLGDNSLYLSIINIIEFHSPIIKYWFVPFEEISTYLSIDTSSFGLAYQLESVIFSPQGKWALMSSFERYAILAGTKDFMKDFSKDFPDTELHILNYLILVKESIDKYGLRNVNKIVWLGNLLRNVYGIDQAKEFLRASELEKYVY